MSYHIVYYDIILYIMISYDICRYNTLCNIIYNRGWWTRFRRGKIAYYCTKVFIYSSTYVNTKVIYWLSVFFVLPNPLKHVSLKVEQRRLAKYIHQFEIHQLLERGQRGQRGQRGHLPWTGIISDTSCRCHLRNSCSLEASKLSARKKIKQV